MPLGSTWYRRTQPTLPLLAWCVLALWSLGYDLVPASHQAQPYRKLYVGARRFDAEMGCTLPRWWGVGREAGEPWPEWIAQAARGAGLVGRMGVKRPKTGSKRRFLEEYATWPITAQLLFQNRVMSRIAVHPSPDRNRRNLIEHINLRRKLARQTLDHSRQT